MFGLYTDYFTLCLQLERALWSIAPEDQYLESSEQFGSPESLRSPWYGSQKGPLMIDPHGTVFGRFQVNLEGGYTQSIELTHLYEGKNRGL